MPFKIIICGAGLAGLGAAIALEKKGHDVTILEAAQQLAEVGAGIQIPPNSSRILQYYGVYDEIEKKVVWPQNIIFRRYATGDVIGKASLSPTMIDRYGFPYWLIHRADFHTCLWQHAVKRGVKIVLNKMVERVDESGPTVIMKGGETMTADIIVGADGIKSRTRESILKSENIDPIDSKLCAYRTTVGMGLMLGDPATAHLMSDVNANSWIGHQRHIMAYPIRDGEMYNLVMVHPGQAPVGKWNELGDLAEMKQHYHNFEPTMCKVLDKVSSCLKWKLSDMPSLPRWISSNGRVVLIGDAAHGMLPFLAQGAATSIEDGAALAECISRAKDTSMIPALLKAFQDSRKPRCEMIQATSRTNGEIWHLPDGPEQEERDRRMAGQMAETSKGEEITSQRRNPNRWADDQFQSWLFGYDTIKETNLFLDGISDTSPGRSESKKASFPSL